MESVCPRGLWRSHATALLRCEPHPSHPQVGPHPLHPEIPPTGKDGHHALGPPGGVSKVTRVSYHRHLFPFSLALPAPALAHGTGRTVRKARLCRETHVASRLRASSPQFVGGESSNDCSPRPSHLPAEDPSWSKHKSPTLSEFLTQGHHGR